MNVFDPLQMLTTIVSTVQSDGFMSSMLHLAEEVKISYCE